MLPVEVLMNHVATDRALFKFYAKTAVRGGSGVFIGLRAGRPAAFRYSVVTAPTLNLVSTL
jgi:hypothetical protein